MGRKRYPSFVESSEDEFEPSEAEASPLFSRLKRPRRPHNRDNSVVNASTERTSVQHENHVNSSVVIPDSLDEDDKSLPESVAESLPQTPKDPRDEDTRETEAPSEKGDDIDENHAEAEEEDDDDDVVEVKEEVDDKNAVQQSPRNVPTSKPDGPTNSGRRRQSRTVYQIESDSEEESEHDNDDDDAYNSAEDSPAGEDDDSEFDFSPQKPAKKKEKIAAKRPVSRQKTQPSPARKLATRKPPIRKLAVRPGAAVSKASAAARSSSKPKPTSDGTKSRLGSRLPFRGLLTGKSSVSDKKRPQSSGKLPSAPVIRSGLSRKAAIPRLHTYLPR